ncbi:MAG TPA: peptidoglycan-binding protein, partial [Xanthobacteraceae bacterium]
AWGHEVKLPAGFKSARAGRAARSYAKWRDAGLARADGKPFARPDDTARLRVPVEDGPAFLTGQNFAAVMSYNPAFSYALAIVHLADRIAGAGPFVKPFPGSERLPVLAEVQEIQHRLTARGYDTGGSDGRAGLGTMRAAAAYQRKVGMDPADGYAGVKLLARLRQGP